LQQAQQEQVKVIADLDVKWEKKLKAKVCYDATSFLNNAD